MRRNRILAEVYNFACGLRKIGETTMLKMQFAKRLLKANS